MKESKRHQNNLGIIGWAIRGRWGIDRYLYTLHRITGLCILSYFLIHILVTSGRVFGEHVWNRLMAGVDPIVFKIGEFFVFLAFAFHAMNGLRLILIELGFKLAVGEADEPVYPYKTSIHRQRPLMIACMIAALILVILGGINFLKVITLH